MASGSGPFPKGCNGSNYVVEKNTSEQRVLKKLALDQQRRQDNESSLVRMRLSQGACDSDSHSIPVVNMSADRIKSIIENTPAVFEIADNPNADGNKPFIEISAFNPIDSGAIYNEMGQKYGVNPDWLKAIAYMENTHGYYDAAPLFNLESTSYRPMNIQYKTWKPLADKLGFTEWQIEYRVACNVELAALIIKRIIARVPNPTLANVASIYNFAGSEKTRDYGARVQAIYEAKLWEK